MSLKRNLIPLKYAFVQIQVLFTIASYIQGDDNVYNSFPSGMTSDSPEIQKAQNSFMVCFILSIIFLAFELIFIFLCFNMRDMKVHVFSILWHFMGSIALIWYTLDNWGYRYIWIIFSFTVVIPFVTEVASNVRSLIKK